MRPRGLPSKWVKITPWYYARRKGRSRASEKKAAIEFDRKANGGKKKLP